MLKDNAGVSFSVVFLDGENTVNIGEIMVDSSLNFKNFQSDIGQKIGVSPHQLSVYFGSRESNRKIPITRKVNFAAIAREKGGFFFVKRRPRRHKTHKESRDEEQPCNKKIPPANVKLLRRNTGIDFYPAFPGFQTPILDRIGYETRVRNLQVEKERYLMNMGLGGLCLGKEPNGSGNRNASGGELVCKVCSVGNASGRDAGFHWCVHDAVTEGFRSPAGPIARPVKNIG
ncbi:uncharacterized protein LOC129291739 [Prosopis cineraria]|uniref:uncharacterized protein LOC129291739 n=1 Tax=Prosopis cineraria TaxID=364024 RepID=UPI00241071B0|nr:uncharacterized protein LOC129291739 [Prosopis cineraria]